MDPVSHVALGRTLAALPWREPVGRGVAVAAMLGALSPDVDAVFMPAGWDRYLRVHEIGTHSLVGTIACAALTAVAVRWYRKDDSWRRLAISAWLGAASHVLLDLLSSARLRLLWPISDRQHALPLVAMADPWLAALLLGGAVATILAARRGWSRRAAALGVATCLLFLGVKAIGAWRAHEGYAASGRPSAQSHVLEAEWASLRYWRVFDRTRTHVRAWRADGVTGHAELLLTWPVGRETPLVTASRSFSTVRNFFRAHGLGFSVTIPRGGAEHWVLWSDVRYCRSPDRAAPASELTVSMHGRTLDCALWVGGAFDGDRNPLLEIVRVGAFTQTRAVPR